MMVFSLEKTKRRLNLHCFLRKIAAGFSFFFRPRQKCGKKKECSVVWAVVHRSTRPTCTRLGRWERMGEVLKPRPSTEPSHFFGRENPLKKSGGFKRVGSKWVVYITFITPRIIYPEFIYIYIYM